MKTFVLDSINADGRELRNAFGCFATGVTIVTTRTQAGCPEGLTCNSFSAVSLDPPLLLWSLRKAAASLANFRATGHFAVSVLAGGQEEVASHFARPHPDKFAGIAHRDGLGGCPLIAGALATFECEQAGAHEAGDHIVFFGRVQRAAYGEGAPLIFSAGQFQQLASNLLDAT